MVRIGEALCLPFFLFMIIKAASFADLDTGATNGQYIQKTSQVASLRKKRIGGTKFNRYTFEQRGRFAQLARHWQSLSGSDQSSFGTWGAPLPTFAHLDSSAALFSYWCYIAFNTRLIQCGEPIRDSISRSALSSVPSISISSATLDPLTVSGSKVSASGGGYVMVYGQCFFGATASPQFSQPLLLSTPVSGNSGLGSINDVLRAKYGEDSQPFSVQLTCFRVHRTGKYFRQGNTVQAFFT